MAMLLQSAFTQQSAAEGGQRAGSGWSIWQGWQGLTGLQPDAGIAGSMAGLAWSGYQVCCGQISCVTVTAHCQPCRTGMRGG